MIRHFNLRFTLFLFFSDLLSVCLALALTAHAREILPFGKAAPTSEWTLPWPVYLMGIAVWGIAFATLNVYNPRQILLLGVELFKLTGAVLFAWLLLAGLLYFTYRNVSRLQYIYLLLLDLLLIYTHRFTVYNWFKFRGWRRYDARRVLIIGTGDIAHEIAEMVRENARLGFLMEGYVAENSETGKTNNPLVLGTLNDTFNLIQKHHISEVVIAVSRQTSDKLQELIHELQSLPVNIRLVPDYFDMAFVRLTVENFSGMPMLSLKEPILDPFQRLVKRAFDVGLTSLLLIPALPVMGVIALAIRRDSPGPVIFKQERVGEGGKLFTMVKFRTMVDGAEHMQDKIATVDDDGNAIYKHANDPRVTRIGHWLRRTSLDELPQLWNILRGEMSLVGPRPEMPWLVDRYELWQRKRFEVPQGLTGWWQISGRADRPMYLHTEDDLYYIRNYSVWIDLKILWLTVQAVILRRGAF